MMIDDAEDVAIQLGISIEPLSAVTSAYELGKSPSIEVGVTQSMTDLASPGIEFVAERVIKNFYNFASGFQEADFIPTRCLNEW
jgi:hypothetical protein